MKTEKIATDGAAPALAALAAGMDICYTLGKGHKMPAGFPRGELIYEMGGRDVYAYDPLKVLAWLSAKGLVNVHATRGGV